LESEGNRDFTVGLYSRLPKAIRDSDIRKWNGLKWIVSALLPAASDDKNSHNEEKKCRFG
jgi:hypothetical protein